MCSDCRSMRLCFLHIISVHFVLAGLRLLGIGRNQYIDLMNATKTNRIVPVSK